MNMTDPQETVDDNNTRWSGLEVFQHLQKLRSSKAGRAEGLGLREIKGFGLRG